MRIIELKTKRGHRLWVDIDDIKALEQKEDYTTIHLKDCNSLFFVKETIEEIGKIIRGDKK